MRPLCKYVTPNRSLAFNSSSLPFHYPRIQPTVRVHPLMMYQFPRVRASTDGMRRDCLRGLWMRLAPIVDCHAAVRRVFYPLLPVSAPPPPPAFCPPPSGQGAPTPKPIHTQTFTPPPHTHTHRKAGNWTPELEDDQTPQFAGKRTPSAGGRLDPGTSRVPGPERPPCGGTKPSLIRHQSLSRRCDVKGHCVCAARRWRACGAAAKRASH